MYALSLLISFSDNGIGIMYVVYIHLLLRLLYDGKLKPLAFRYDNYPFYFPSQRWEFYHLKNPSNIFCFFLARYNGIFRKKLYVPTASIAFAQKVTLYSFLIQLCIKVLISKIGVFESAGTIIFNDCLPP